MERRKNRAKQDIEDSAMVQFMLAEYERFKETQLQMLQGLHAKVNIYITIMSFAIGAVLYLQDPLTPAVCWLLLAMLIIGVTTFAGLINLEFWASEYGKKMRFIRDQFVKDREIRKHFPIDPWLDPKLFQWSLKDTDIILVGLTAGGEKSLVVIVDSLAFAALVVIAVVRTMGVLPLWEMGGIVVLSILASSFLHVFYMRMSCRVKRRYLDRLGTES